MPECLQCTPKRLFVNPSSLKRHQREVHRIDCTKPRQTCKDCGKTFTRTENLVRHNAEKHTGERFQACKHCTRPYRQDYLQKHEKKCGLRFAEQRLLPGWNHEIQAKTLKWTAPVNASETRQLVISTTAAGTRSVLKFVRVPPISSPHLNYDDVTEIAKMIKQDDLPRLKDYAYHRSQRRSLHAFDNFYSEANDNGYSLLHTAVLAVALRISSHLLAAGIPIDVPSLRGSTPLHLAAGHGTVDMLTCLIQARADVGKLNNARQSVLHCLAGNFRLEQKEMLSITGEFVGRGALIDSADQYNETALCDFAAAGYDLVVRELLEYGANVDGASGNYGSSPLVALCKSKPASWEAVLDVLLEYGVDINLWRPKREGIRPNTALAEACAGRTGSVNNKMVSRLLAAGAMPNIGEDTPLVNAFVHGSIETLRLLLDYGADPTRVTTNAVRAVDRPSWLVPHQADKKVSLLQRYTEQWQAEVSGTQTV